MERIRLSNDDKKILRELKRGNSNIPNGMNNFSFFDSVVSLSEKGLIKSKTNYDEVLAVELLPKGFAYLNCNPNLKNPIRWDIVTGISAGVAAISATLALFVSCCK